ncbi:fatty acid desaturase [Rhodoferax lacus]|uniref:Fatty acid desaturase n=1 Tax=Rhodoferax lacus TaxID=2184758 RepID=A0A3E1R877_9BURK|nr:fatty acid desaturase [Rhodoferax lacus]RFO95566.1 fatty acid desaturase [Rhodoferax lacus]
MQDDNVPRSAIEWPTWMVWLTVWGAWLVLVENYDNIPAWIATPLLIVLVAWYMSFQHELTHGHPTRNETLNRLIGLPPLAIWYPFDTYKADHLKHHDDAHLTEPGVDTESNYITPEQAATMGTVALWLYKSQRTVLGRLLIGPAIVIVSLATRIARGLRAGDWTQLRVWAVHLPLVALLLWALERYTSVSAWHYCFGIAYPALGLAMLRSLYEHRPGALPTHRTVINEAAAPWRLLYLNNNYHVVHHAYPQAPWYQIPALYHADPAAWQAGNGGFVLPGYLYLIRHFAWTPVDSPVLAAPATAPQRAAKPARAAAKP